MTDRIWVDRSVGRLALRRWGAPDSGKPPALLVHGTGFNAEVWHEVANGLTDRYTVYAVDRRGHGASFKPAADSYHFEDFADDLCAVIHALELSAIYGIGHSAGATDLLLAAKLLPGRFDRLLVMEPTVMDPRLGRVDVVPTVLSEAAEAAVRGVLRRRAVFDDADSLYRRLQAAPVFASWTSTSLWAYVRHGFEAMPDGRLRLLCAPPIESAILLPIYQAMEQVYTGDSRGNPFGWLCDLRCPVQVTTAQLSGSVYHTMAARAVSLIPGVSQWSFEGLGHCVAQEAPEQVLAAIASFACQD